MKFNNYRPWIALTTIVGLLGLGTFFLFSFRGPEISLLELSNQIKRGQVKSIAVEGDDLSIVYNNGKRKAQSKKEPGVSLHEALEATGLQPERLRKVAISVSAKGPWSLLFSGLPLWIIAASFIVLAFIFSSKIMRSSDQFGAKLNRKPEKIVSCLADFGGYVEIESILAPIVSWLNRPNVKLGIDIPRGLLITGPTGSGKTLLAHAIAGETGRHFFSYTGSEFIELLVGMGSSRMRNAFDEVRQYATKDAPCIIFFDHIDLIASERTATLHPHITSESETQRTLAQLMGELDDLSKNGLIYVIAATSRPRILDSALLGPGRLSLRIDLQLPNEKTRKEILEKQLKTKLLAPDVDLSRIARSTETFSGAELVQLIHTAAEFAKKRTDMQSLIHDSTANYIEKLSFDDFVRAKAQILPQPHQQLPTQIVEYLDKYVVGQESAKKRLAVVVSNHYLRLNLTNRFISFPVDIKKSNILFIGPTGSGKTMLIETIADYLEVPYVVFNSTVLTETGYSGACVEQMLYKLLVAADLNLRKAEYGIVCIDEFDKLAFLQGERTRHTAAGVQQELLKLVEGTVVDVSKSGNSQYGSSSDNYQFDTRNILFVALGAFNGLESVIDQRVHISRKRTKPTVGMLKQVQPEDVINYGFIPELIGRFPVISYTDALSVEELEAILLNPHNGLVHEYISLLKIQGWENPSFDPEAITRIAQEAWQRHVGARGLRTIMEEVLLERMYQRPGSGEYDDETQLEARVGQSVNIEQTPLSKSLRIDASSVDQALVQNRIQTNHRTDMTTERILTQLDEQFPGNTTAKQVLAVVSFDHYSRIVENEKKTLEMNGQQELSDSIEAQMNKGGTQRQAILLIDPYTEQRYTLVRALAQAWKVPCTVCNAVQLERNLNARSVQNIEWLLDPVRDLLEKSGYDRRIAQQGIIFIDDFDLLLSRVTVDTYFNTFDQRLISLLEGRPLSLRDAEGHIIEFVTSQLFLVLGGNFRPAKDFGNFSHKDDLSMPEYLPFNIITNLSKEFHITPDLLQYLIPVPMDLSINENHLEKIIRKFDKQIHNKYGPHLIKEGVLEKRSPEYYQKLVRQALEEGWAASEIGIKLESILVEQLYKRDLVHEHP